MSCARHVVLDNYVHGKRTAASPWRHSMPVRTFPQHSAIAPKGALLHEEFYAGRF